MKVIRLIPFILLITGTFGLLTIEFLVAPEADVSRCLTLTFAVLNVLGLIVLALTYKKS